MRRSRSPPPPPPPHLIWPWGRELSSPTSVLLVKPPRGSVSRCVCGQAAWEVPRCSPHALPLPGWGHQCTSSFYAHAPPVRWVPQSASLPHRETEAELKSSSLPSRSTSNRGGGVPSGAWPGILMLRGPWLSSTHSCDRASISPFCKMLMKCHHLLGVVERPQGAWEGLGEEQRSNRSGGGGEGGKRGPQGETCPGQTCFPA